MPFDDTINNFLTPVDESLRGKIIDGLQGVAKSRATPVKDNSSHLSLTQARDYLRKNQNPIFSLGADFGIMDDFRQMWVPDTSRSTQELLREIRGWRRSAQFGFLYGAGPGILRDYLPGRVIYPVENHNQNVAQLEEEGWTRYGPLTNPCREIVMGQQGTTGSLEGVEDETPDVSRVELLMGVEHDGRE